MERKFRITVDGRLYNVTVEDLNDAGLGHTPQPVLHSHPTPAPVATAQAVPQAAAQRAAAGAGDVVCTLGGVVESVAVTIGQTVSAGDKVVVIEAMKMKTPMTAHCNGRVTAVAVKVGEAVETGQVLLTIA